MSVYEPHAHQLIQRRWNPSSTEASGRCTCGARFSVTTHFETGTITYARSFATARVVEKHREHLEQLGLLPPEEDTA